MKNFIIVSDVDNGQKFIHMPDSYYITVTEDNDVIYIEFFEKSTNRLLHVIWLFIEAETEKERDFAYHTEKGQELILASLRKYILEDIRHFLEDEKDEAWYEIFPLKNHDLFISEEFESRWYIFYDMILDREEVVNEYIKPD